MKSLDMCCQQRIFQLIAIFYLFEKHILAFTVK